MMLRLASVVLAAALIVGPALAQSGDRAPGARAIQRPAGAPTVLQGSPDQDQTDEPDVSAGAPVPSPDEGRAVIPNYLRRSGSRAGGPANDLNPSGRPEAPPLPGGSVEGAVSGRELYHGNYCGVGNRGEGLPPTDALDVACMHHDACYDRAGHRSCACDRQLEREAAAVANSPRYSRELRERAGIVVQAGNVMQCESP